MKVLFLDIETAPHKGYFWGLWDQRIGTNQIVEHGYTLCFSARWLGERELIFDSIFQSKPDAMFRKVHKLLDEADAVCHYNGRKFDIPTLQGEFVRRKMLPPAPFKHIDLLTTCRRQFRFASNKLDYVAELLGLGQKVQHKGMPLWTACMAGDAAAWRLMEHYNKQDVRLLERLYRELLPWIKNHPNQGAYDGGECCPNCAGQRFQRRGYAVSQSRRYARLQCRDCGTWIQSVRCEPGSARLKGAA